MRRSRAFDGKNHQDLRRQRLKTWVVFVLNAATRIYYRHLVGSVLCFTASKSDGMILLDTFSFISDDLLCYFILTLETKIPPLIHASSFFFDIVLSFSGISVYIG